MTDLTQLGRYQKGAAERLVIKTALIALIELALEGREQCQLSRSEVEECLDTIFLCSEILKGVKS